MRRTKLDANRRILILWIVMMLVAIVIIIKVFTITIVENKKWKEKMHEQQNHSRIITAFRGNIYDNTEKNILAQSSSSYMVTINPVRVKEKEKVAMILSEIFDLEYEKIMKKVNKHSAIEIIKKKCEKEKIEKLREWMNQNNIYDGINIDEDSKRFYPYGELASHVIGFIGSDNQGLDGIEAKYNEELAGKNGQIKIAVDGSGKIINDSKEIYEKYQMGNGLILSIDLNIQAIVEKYLEEACIENVCTDGGNVIMMDPKNGDVLAMATYPNYNLNNPYDIKDENIKNIWDQMDSKDKNIYLQSVWRNKAIADTYEPGSTFKLVTASAALEENIAETDKKGAYCCSGGIEVAGVRMKCWRYYRPHGSESLRDALMNSCNPVFILLGQKMGKDIYYSYLEKFGFLKKTKIDLPGEAGSIFLKKEKVGPVELGTISFGQRFEVTPIQMVTMVSTIANKGMYVKPRIVKGIIDSQTGEKRYIEPENKSVVISKDTAEKILSMMTSVVAEGTGKNARVSGYDVGGKTGTSEDGVNTGKYVTSFIGVAPTNDPKVTILVTLYDPKGPKGHQGGTIAAPVAGKILKEVLEYME